ncbi:hypothetical protein BKA70DRAFT_1295776 [Coprinopsis sp. MPI-PUGE-AT-0042]|nr:hypothetical protein BKA70DRAFT_1295776 [Coprinopsis sp. MPI-PUGE-AT-0042]
MNPSLPLELIREISLYLSSFNDARTLQSAALISSAFRVPCQEVIFSRVNIYKRHMNKDNSTHHLTGLSILRRNPSLARYVQAVSIKNVTGCNAFTVDFSPISPCTTELLRLLSTPSLEEIIFVGWRGFIVEQFQDVIAKMIGLPRLKNLSLSSAPVQLLCFVKSCHLKTLSFVQATEQSSWSLNIIKHLPSPPTHPIAFPTQLELSAEPSVIAHFNSSHNLIDLGAVETLKFDTQSHGSIRGNIYLLLACCAPVLRTLHVSTNDLNLGSSCFPDPLVSQTIGQLVELRELEVLCSNSRHQPRSNPHPGLPTFLEALPSLNSISHIGFTVQLLGRDHSSLAGARQFWDGVDQILCNPGSFPELKSLHFDVTFQRNCPPSKHELEACQQEEQGYWSKSKMSGITVAFSHVEMLM